ncbi:exodeoxyribonuclease V subunit gamma, partial [Draconibacterium sp.]|nr:exodeoxyribonuclease V subunit gamma [Draconibacterium sp.]
MALTIYRSNRVEMLQARLVQRLAAMPLSDPFATEVVVVPTYAMGRWLNLNFARQQGIAANIAYPQPGEWVWSLAGRLLDDIPQQDPYTRETLGWSIFNTLPDLLKQAAFASLQHYLNDDSSGIKRWQLSQRIADCFDRYQSSRPDLIRGWSQGEGNDWQALLWRKLVTTRELPHRVDIMQRLVQHLNKPDLENVSKRGRLPERISLFALSRIPPTYLEILHALAEHTELLLFQHNPTDQYWADLVSAKQQARQRLQSPQQGEYFDSGNYLLTSWGRQGQTLQDLLLDLGPITSAEIEDNYPPSSSNLLHSLQASLFHLEQPRFADSVDDSVSVQLCHSPLRECQVLHDHLLTLLARHDDLSTEDILVMVPEISRYAPYIEAAFQQDTSNRRPNLPWNISDISVSDGHPLVGVFLQLLGLPTSRFARSEIMSLLECAEIRSRFGIDSSALDAIEHLIASARVRWGINAQQRRDLGLPGIHENTWQQAWERI